LGHELDETSCDKTRMEGNTTHEKKGGDMKLSLSSLSENQIHIQGHLFKL
jgi:hypothetical protein